jgi:hypothetical protein
MIFAALLAMLAPPQPNPFDKFDRAKLIIIPVNQPALTVDYPTMEQCKRARSELLRQDHETDAQDKALANKLGRPVIRQHISAYCIPS